MTPSRHTTVTASGDVLPMATQGTLAKPRGVLVCGLGRLGRSCVSVLREFGIPLHAVDLRALGPEAADAAAQVDSFTVGDCRLPSTLKKAAIDECRAVLLVTSDDRVNVAAAFAVRALDAEVRIVVRSAQQGLNDLLTTHLGNLAAFEPTQLSAPAFTLAALGDDTVGLFRLDEQLVRVMRVTIDDHHGLRGRRLLELNTKKRRIVGHQRAGESSSSGFHAWEPDAVVNAGDVLTTIELDGDTPFAPDARTDGDGVWRWARRILSFRSWRRELGRLWREGSQVQRVAVVCALTLAALYATGALLYKAQYPAITARDSLNVAMVLILGGYDNLFGQLQLPFPIPAWLHLYSVLLSVAGTVGIGIVYAFLTERVLSVRFQFWKRRPAVPRADHVVLVGLGVIGEQIARQLRDLRRPFVAIGEETLGAETAIPFVVGRGDDAFQRAHLRRARSVLALDDDEVANVEVALRARAHSPACTVVIRTEDAHFTANVAKLLPGARPLGVYALAAEAFAAAAFGEDVHGILHVDRETSLLTEYKVDATDTLHGKLVGEVAYGYGFVPLLLRRGHAAALPFPSDDLRLEVNDQLVVLASIEGLRNAEHGAVRVPSCRVHIEAALSPDASFAGALATARISGCEVAIAKEVISRLPAILPVALYEHQAERLVQELGKVRVRARWSRT